jgi:hypothetical protein
MGKAELHVLLRMGLTLHNCIYSLRQSPRAAEWQARFGKVAECELTGDGDLVGPGVRVVRTCESESGPAFKEIRHLRHR